MEIFDSGIIEKIIRNDIKQADTPKSCANCPQPEGRFPDETPVGMFYVPMQSWGKVYDPDAALCRGTLFPDLDKPFIGEEAVRNGK